MITLTAIDKNDAEVKISQQDEYLDKLTLLNIKKITKNKIESVEEFPEYLKTTCIDWDEKLKKRIEKIEATVNYQLQEVGFNFEMDIELIRTNGKDSFNLPYTRDNTIYIPKKENKKSKLGHLSTHLIVHEIFHIISRKYPQIRDALYSIMGFTKLKKELDIEKEVERYIVNPDALTYRHAITIVKDMEEYKGIPLLFFKRNSMKWEYLILLDLEENFVELVDRRDTTFSTLKYNTGYQSHPEEICAENFRKWIMQDKSLDNPELMVRFSSTMKDLFN